MYTAFLCQKEGSAFTDRIYDCDLEEAVERICDEMFNGDEKRYDVCHIYQYPATEEDLEVEQKALITIEKTIIGFNITHHDDISAFINQ